jgi:hypothetical protein
VRNGRIIVPRFLYHIGCQGRDPELNPTPRRKEIAMSRISAPATVAGSDASTAAAEREMVTETRPSSDIAFTPAVKALQDRRGSRRGYAAMEARGGWQTQITDDLAAFIAAQRSYRTQQLPCHPRRGSHDPSDGYARGDGGD